MKIQEALNRVRSLSERKKEINAALELFDRGYVVRPQRISLHSKSEGIAKWNEVEVQLSTDQVKQTLVEELAEIVEAIESIAPVIDAANAMLKGIFPVDAEDKS